METEETILTRDGTKSVTLKCGCQPISLPAQNIKKSKMYALSLLNSLLIEPYASFHCPVRKFCIAERTFVHEHWTILISRSTSDSIIPKTWSIAEGYEIKSEAGWARFPNPGTEIFRRTKDNTLVYWSSLLIYEHNLGSQKRHSCDNMVFSPKIVGRRAETNTFQRWTRKNWQ